MKYNVYVYFYPLPDGINEAVCPCDGGYNVTIDPRQSYDGVIRSYLHALKHINNNDFEKENVNEIERQAHERS